MNTRCPTCGRAVATPNRQQRRRQLAHQIARLDERIRSIENGDLLGVIRQQAAAPSCTICEQAPPGKPGQPTTAPALARPLRQQKRRLERELKRLT
ncbi:MAG TPA: hypothetical protein VFZ25_08180 [Chloroflexota bacterium]|nr:hypothetical protein [Chloroflexota bacterium]